MDYLPSQLATMVDQEQLDRLRDEMMESHREELDRTCVQLEDKHSGEITRHKLEIASLNGQLVLNSVFFSSIHYYCIIFILLYHLLIIHEFGCLCLV